MFRSAVIKSAVALLLVAGFAAGEIAAEEFPTRPVEMIVNFGPGGSADQAGRAVARWLPEVLGVPVPVSNVTGASGNSGLTRVKNASPDGYTIGTFTGIAVTTMIQGASRHNIDDFRYLAVADAGISMFFVGKDSKFKSFQDLLDHAKANPGTIRVSTAGLGTQDDVAVQALSRAGHPVVNVPMDPGPRHTAPMAGHAEVLFQQIDAVTGLVESGDLVPIVVFSDERHDQFPDVPIAQEFGFDLNLPNFRAFATSAKVPDDRAEILANAIGEILQREQYQEICRKQYKCVPLMTGEDAASYIRTYYDDMETLMTTLGLAGS